MTDKEKIHECVREGFNKDTIICYKYPWRWIVKDKNPYYDFCLVHINFCPLCGKDLREEE